ncbi:hypothetical protein Tsubulata_001132 [Turnera subulata]|uniref:Uncharacterized protein n=1 Tax=Turnera subulata TaxID=218843 RepID=A0A9Q0G0F2_9ROSI|nr:hypothetical protein Tsubulata_001132 [Turnera subulata]
MGRAPCCSKIGLLRGPWTAREDELLVNYIQENGEGHWRSLPKKAGLLRCGKSCRLRWMNYLRPGIKRGNITPEEDDLIIRLHSLLGNRWSLIAGRLPGRTDNEIKNYWNSHLSKRLKQSCTTTSKRNKKTQEKGSHEHQDNAADGESAAKTKIHLPKAVRVSAFIPVTRKLSRLTSHAGIANREEPLREYSGLIEATDTEIDVAYCDHDALVQDFIPESDNGMLDDIFGEYQKLISDNDLAQLDSFLDSILA